MIAAVPLIYSPRAPRVRVGPVGRVVAFLCAILCLAPLLTAAWITPDPSGMGTHTQLGLAACGFQRTFGIPCPTCGMTTSWAWFARGNWVASAWIQPMGMLLAFMAAAIFWAGMYIAATGRAAHQLLRYVPSGYIVQPLLALALLAWGWKIFIHLNRLDGWK